MMTGKQTGAFNGLKYFLIIFLTCTVLLFIVPLAAINLLSGDSGLAICFILFYLIAPMLSFAVGINAGRSLKSRFWAPLLPAGIFALAMWILFEFADPAFGTYAAAYLAIGVGAMLIRHLFTKNRG